MNLIPCNNYVLVSPFVEKESTENESTELIFLEEKDKEPERYSLYQIEAMSAAWNLNIKKGQKIVLPIHAVEEISIRGKIFFLASEKQIVAVLDE